MNARKLATICALLAALSNLIGCESSRSPDPQFQKQVMRAQECRQLQDRLVGDQPLTQDHESKRMFGWSRRRRDKNAIIPVSHGPTGRGPRTTAIADHKSDGQDKAKFRENWTKAKAGG